MPLNRVTIEYNNKLLLCHFACSSKNNSGKDGKSRTPYNACCFANFLKIVVSVLMTWLMTIFTQQQNRGDKYETETELI